MQRKEHSSEERNSYDSDHETIAPSQIYPPALKNYNPKSKKRSLSSLSSTIKTNELNPSKNNVSKKFNNMGQKG